MVEVPFNVAVLVPVLLFFLGVGMGLILSNIDRRPRNQRIVRSEDPSLYGSKYPELQECKKWYPPHAGGYTSDY